MAKGRIVWVSFAYGFGHDLAYFAPLFAEFKRRMPGTTVPVEHDYPVDRYPGLPLLPVLHFWRKHLKRTAGAGTYEGDLPLPKLSVPVALGKLPADVYVLIEFSAVAILGLVVAKLKRKKSVLLIESDPKFRGTPPGSRSEAIKGFLARRADAVLAGNDAARDFALNALRVDPERLVVGAYLTSQPMVDGDVRGTSTGERVRLLFLNSVNDRKGIKELIFALGELTPADRQRCVLDVVGGGDKLAEMKHLVEQLGLQDCVLFHGKCNYAGIGTAYQHADIVVCPTLADYRSLAAIEAVNAGKPVLVSKYDGVHDELVAATTSAIGIDPTDIGELAATLRALLVDDEVRERLIAHARENIPAKFTVEEAARNVERAIELAVAGH